LGVFRTKTDRARIIPQCGQRSQPGAAWQDLWASCRTGRNPCRYHFRIRNRFGEFAMKIFIFAVLLAILPAANTLADTPGKSVPPKNGMIKVAIVLSEHATVIDFAGPWEVFQDTSIDDGHGHDIAPFELYTVASTKAPVHTEGSNRPGMTITPDYSFADAPTPDIVVVGAQSGGAVLSEWLQKIHADDKLIM
jgi:hypothetical protein